MKTLLWDRKWVILFSIGFSFNLLLFSPAWSLDYPTKPITIVASASAGGPSDLHARILGEVVSKELGTPVVVVNKGGPGGALAASSVANEKPDGYTFLVTQSGTMTSNFVLFPNLPYKRTDLVPLFRSVVVPCSVAVKADSPWKTFQDFLEAVKKNPGKVRSGTCSANISLIWQGLMKHEGLDITHLMYKGAPDALLALMGGHVDVYPDAVAPMVSHIEAGKIRLLASISSKRNKQYPEVSTLYELGYHTFSKDLWNGFFAPVGVPQPILDKVTLAFQKALSQPNVQVQIEKVGLFAGYMSPKEFSDLIDNEYKFYMDVGKQAK